MGNKSNYSRNQCSLIVRVDGKELEIPCNFGMTANEIRAIYPFLAQLANAPVKNPALQFHEDAAKGIYSDMNDEEYADLVDDYRRQSAYWYNKPEASLLDIAIRMALDIQFKGVQEIQHAFMDPVNYRKLRQEQVTDEEADKILKEAGMDSEIPDVDMSGELDVENGIAGSVAVDIYGTGDAGEFMSEQLDKMDAERHEDRFDKIINDDIPDKYKSTYKPDGFKEGQIGEDGLLDMYAGNESVDKIFGDEPDDGSTAEELLSDNNNKQSDTSDDITEEGNLPNDEDDLFGGAEEPVLDALAVYEGEEE